MCVCITYDILCISRKWYYCITITVLVLYTSAHVCVCLCVCVCCLVVVEWCVCAWNHWNVTKINLLCACLCHVANKLPCSNVSVLVFYSLHQLATPSSPPSLYHLGQQKKCLFLVTWLKKKK